MAFRTLLSFSCSEARLVVRIMNSDKKSGEMTDEEYSACEHYNECNDCKKIGLAAIVQKEPLSCVDALLQWAKKPGPLYLDPTRTVRDELAVEHVLGRPATAHFVIGSKVEFDGIDPHFEACRERACAGLRHYWERAPLSSDYEGERETAFEHAFLIKLFLTERWPLETIISIQKERVDMLLGALVAGKLIDGYFKAGDLVREVQCHLKVLQELTLFYSYAINTREVT